MNDMIKWIIVAVLLVGLIAGASVLYNSLGDNSNSGGLIIDMPSDNNTGSADNADGTAGTQEMPNTDNASDMPTTMPPDDSTQQDTDTSETPEEPENPAPDFTMVDIKGNKVKLSDLRGKPVVLNFWASWCGYCIAEMPDFEEYYKIHGKDIHFVMLNTLSNGETVSSGKKFISDKGYTFPVYFDEDGVATYKYVGPNGGIPRTYFIDAKGNLVAHAPGMLTADILKQGIDMIS